MREAIMPAEKPDPFGLRKVNFESRVPEKSEMFSREEALTYIQGCDYPESADDLLLAIEVQNRFRDSNIKTMHILDSMCGPGRLGRELLKLGAKSVTFHDGDVTMMNHAAEQALATKRPQQEVNSIISPVDAIAAPDNAFDLVVCHNSTHQLSELGRLHTVLKEFVRVTKPGGFVLIADYQRASSPQFLDALEQRLAWTKPSIIPLLVPTFTAAFSKEEFDNAFHAIPGIKTHIVIDAALPDLTEEMKKRVNVDPVKGHVLDFSPISLRAIAQKENI